MLDWTINGLNLIIGILIFTSIICIIVFMKKSNDLLSNVQITIEKNTDFIKALDSSLSKLIDIHENSLKQIYVNQNKTNENLDKSIHVNEKLYLDLTKMLNNIEKIASDIKITLDEVVKIDLA